MSVFLNLELTILIIAKISTMVTDWSLHLSGKALVTWAGPYGTLLRTFKTASKSIE